MNQRMFSSRPRKARFIPLALKSLALALLFCFNAVAPVPAQEAPKQLTSKERSEVFQQVWESVRDYHVDPKLGGVDWKAIREKYRPQVEKVQQDRELWALLEDMVSELNDPHTWVLSPRIVTRREARQSYIYDVELTLVEGRIVIKSVLPDSEAARGGVTPGMAVRFVNNRPIGELWKELKEEASLLPPVRAPLSRLVRLLHRRGPDGKLKLTIRHSETANVVVPVNLRVVSSEPEVKGRWLPSGIAYVRLSGFGSRNSKTQISEVFEKALEPYRKAPGLILDLRDNYGGLLSETLTIAGFFLGGDVLVGFSERRYAKTQLLETPKWGKIFKGRVTVLTNEETASAAEILASALQEKGKAPVIGTQTCGCLFGISTYRNLKGGGKLAISESAFFNTQQKLLEGIGVVPDKVVLLTIADLKSGRDAAMEEAERILLAPPAK